MDTLRSLDSDRAAYSHGLRRLKGSENVSPDMGDDYSLSFSPSPGVDDISSSPVGVNRYSYGSDSFVSED